MRVGMRAGWLLLVALLAPAAPVVAAHDHADSGFVVFASLEAYQKRGAAAHTDHTGDPWGIADAVLSWSRGRLRLFAELNASSREFDLERFQLGIEPVPDTVIWFGRFHQPASAWNSQHHHGRYLQTAITRPSIEYWEDEEGVIPQHLVGVLLESRRPLGRSGGVQLEVGAGAGSNLDGTQLEPVELLARTHGAHRLSTTARLAWLPQYLGGSSVGLLFGWHDIPVRDAAQVASLGTRRLRQQVSGAYVDWGQEPWRVKAAVYHLGMSPRAAGGGSFAAGYVQAEWQVSPAWTPFARHEDSRGAAQSRYVALFADDFARRADLLGLRWDFRRRQALTLELAWRHTLAGASSEARLQWSAALP